MADIKAVAANPRDTKCLTKEQLLKYTDGKGLVLNSDGTVSVYYNNPELGLYPVQLTLECCKVLDPTYYFDINTQTCRHAQPHDTCGFSEPINLIVNPKENDGTLFFIDDFQKETCDLKISFDYLLKIKCEDLLNIANPTIATNIQSQQTINQIVKTEMEIEYVNSQIETITNTIVNLNIDYLNTPYSMECAQFPVVITTPDPINCAVSAWSAWSTCANGFQTQTRTITTQPANGGTACPVLSQTQSCSSVCIPPANMAQRNFYFQNGATVFTGSEASACAAAQLTNGLWAWNTPYLVNGIIAVGVKVYADTSTPCRYLPDGYYITNLSTKEITHVVNGTVVSITNCAAAAACYNYNVQTSYPGNVIYTTCAGIQNQVQYVSGNAIICARANTIMGATSATPQGTCTTSGFAKIAAFDKSGFSEVATDLTANLDVYQKGSTTTYIYVNYCLTELGLQTWQNILGPTRYQQFILGNPNSYTCDDVIALANQPNAGELFYDCDVPFGTKSEIWVQITELMTQLNTLSTYLTQLENELIILQNTFITSTTSTKGCTTMIDALESLDIEMHLDIVNADNSLTSVFSAATFPAINSTTNLYDYLINNPNSGFYICGDPSKDNVGFSDCTTLSLDSDVEPNVDSCNSIVDDLIDGLIKESGSDINSISYNAFASQWLSYSTVISNPAIIALITNKKIKISFKIKFSCVDFCLLLDNLVLDKSCKSVDRNDITISQNPGFDLKRVIDNKKSWIDNTLPTNREFVISKSNGTNPIRQTDYNVNDERLVINSKEIDLDISVASAIETDVWCYLNDNPCALTAACTSTIAISNNNPYIDEPLVFSGTPVTINDCTDYNSVLANRNANIETTPCGTILRFRYKTAPPFQVVYYYWLVQQPNGDVEFYYQDDTTFTNLSNVYQNGRECCEYLNVDLQYYNKRASQADDFEVYWDEDCQRCKVEKARCGDVNLDFHTLVTEPISGVTTIEQFENLMVTELIDVKNRQTITSYPTLRAIYDRYLHSSEYCGTVSSAFDYQNMDRFAGLIGNYWIDLIEQVVPSTTIWGSVKIYTNTIFDEQKFKYKSYSSLLCKNPFENEHVLSPINGVYGVCQGVNVIYKDLTPKRIKSDWYTTNFAGELVMPSASEQLKQVITVGADQSRRRIKSPINICDNLCIVQMNSGSEFISYIDIPVVEIVPTCTDCNDTTIDLSDLNYFNLSYMVNNSDNTKMYVSDYTGNVIVVNTLTDTVTTTIPINPLGNGIRRMVYSPNNRLYVICWATDNVIVIDTITDTILAVIFVGIQPQKGTYVSYNGYLYITNSLSNDVNVIDTVTNLIVTTIPVGSFPIEIVYNPDLRVVYVSSQVDGTVSVIDVVGNTVIATISVGISNYNLRMHYVSYNQHLYVYNWNDIELLIINTINNEVINSIGGIVYGYEMTFNPSNKYLYLSTNDTMTIINTLDDTVVATPSLNSEQSIYVPSTNNIYAGVSDGTLTTIDSSNTGVEVRNVPGKSSYAIFNPSNESIYVCSPNTITIFKCINNKPKSQSVIKECALTVTINNQGDHNGQILLVAQTIGGTLPFTYLWSNGETTPEIYVTEPNNYSVKVTDVTCCSKTAQYQLPGKNACWYSMPENGIQLMMTWKCGIYSSGRPTSITIESLIINNGTTEVEYVTSPISPILLDSKTITWIPATTNNYMDCNSSNPSYTYSNFVDYLNDVFSQYGLTNYKAQNSLIDLVPSDGIIPHNATCGMYIIKPSNETFTMKVSVEDDNLGLITMVYTPAGIFDENMRPLYGYKNIICTGINYDEATNSVIE